MANSEVQTHVIQLYEPTRRLHEFRLVTRQTGQSPPKRDSSRDSPNTNYKTGTQRLHIALSKKEPSSLKVNYIERVVHASNLVSSLFYIDTASLSPSTIPASFPPRALPKPQEMYSPCSKVSPVVRNIVYI